MSKICLPTKPSNKKHKEFVRLMVEAYDYLPAHSKDGE